MNVSGISDSVRMENDVAVCAQCGSTSRVGRGFCLNCLLRRGLGADTEHTETLDDVLDEVDVRDADWRIGNYQILEEIGRGGMGVIYRARQRHSRRIVALKRVLSYHADSRETLARFRREAEAAASLDHPNILPIYEVSEGEDGLPFFSMKFAPGGSLVDEGPALRDEPRRSVALMAKVAHAVHYAHGQGILHRDLKPGNVMLDGRGEPLVSDFGLAKWLDTTSDLTRTLTVFGTPGYIAPEQARGPAAKLTPAADVYSLGAILFDLFTGRPPFLGEHALAVIQQAAERPASKLRSLAPALDRDLETICARCLEREPNARYRSAGDLAEDLERWLEGRPIIARPVPPAVRVWRWSKRNPKLAGSIAACLLASGAAAVWQIQSQHLQSTVRREQLAAHSIAVLPFLDLDEISPDLELTVHVANILHHESAKLGLSEVRPINQTLRQWTGSGIQDEVEEAAKITHARAVLTGTRRQTNGRTRISVHLLNANGGAVWGNWLLEENSPGSLESLAPPIYSALEESPTVPALQDSVMLNDRARALYTTGRDLLVRRTFTDVQRAISCLEGAVREEPSSIVARSYLAMAYVGMNFQSSRPEFMEKALRFAREAVELAPRDPTANRGLYVVYVSYGRYQEAREYAFRALEFGDRSERAFGQIAFSWHMAGRPDKAIKWYEKAKISQQQPADYENYLGDCWTDLGLDARARAAYQASASIRPDHPDGWIGLCRLKILARDCQGARQIYRDQLGHYTGTPEPKEIAAVAEFFARDYNAAQVLYTELAKADSLGGGRDMALGTVDYRSALARLKLERKDRQHALDLLRECVASQKSRLNFAPRDMTALYGLSAAEAMLGQSDASLKDLRAAIDSGWIDYRATQLDPRFDAIRELSEFKTIISELANHIAELRTAFTSRNSSGDQQLTKD
jgi:serine/threonine protein kinase/Tfp pilus assembly protein PilF